MMGGVSAYWTCQSNLLLCNQTRNNSRYRSTFTKIDGSVTEIVSVKKIGAGLDLT